MPVQSEWVDEQKTISLITMPENFTMRDVFQAAVDHRAMLDEIDHRVYLILNYASAHLIPQDFMLSFPDMRDAAPTDHPNHGPTIVVGGQLIKGLVEIFSMLHSKLHYAPTLEEAYQLIDEFKRGANR